MGKETGISWTDHTFNPWWGCTKVSPGCDHCYAETFDKRVGGAHWGKGAERRVFGDKHWNEPLKWNEQARKTGGARVFCASMADVMDDEAPEGQRERLWNLIDQTPYLTWQLLTKLPHRYARYLPASFAHNNVWLGITAENQGFYDVRWPILRIVAGERGLTTYISYEPAIGSLSMDAWVMSQGDTEDEWDDYPNWLIFGGETGGKRRPMEREWIEILREEADASGTALFVKQFSAVSPAKAAELIPAHLLIRQFPASAGKEQEA